MTEQKRKNTLATGFGFVAIVLWATTVPVARGVLEKLDVWLGAALIFLPSGILLILLTTLRARGFRWILHLSMRHLVFCGPLFIGYLCLFYLALGLAETRSEAIVVGLINYLWPTMILLFAIPLLGRRPRRLAFAVGSAISLGGIVLAMSVQSESLGALIGALGTSGLPMLLALVASVMWGLYSNLAKRYPQTISTGAVGLFLLVTGLSLLAASGKEWGGVDWTLKAIGELSYMIVFPSSLAYCFWDIAMRDGNIALLGSASNLIPVLATLLAGVYLQVTLGWGLLGGAMGVVLGAFLCQLAFRQGTR